MNGLTDFFEESLKFGRVFEGKQSLQVCQVNIGGNEAHRQFLQTDGSDLVDEYINQRSGFVWS